MNLVYFACAFVAGFIVACLAGYLWLAVMLDKLEQEDWDAR